MSKGEAFGEKPLVGIIMGSDTDLPVMSESARMLTKFSIPFEIEVVSAHRSPARTHEYATTAIERGLKVVIVAAGGAAHLAGVVAALTTLPVIAVPIRVTATMPMMTPSAVNADRSLFARIWAKAIRKDSVSS